MNGVASAIHDAAMQHETRYNSINHGRYTKNGKSSDILGRRI